MKKEELIARLGKTARQVEVEKNSFEVVKAVFFVPFMGEGSFKYSNSEMTVDFLSAGGERVGLAMLNINLGQQSYIRLSKMEICGVKFDVAEDLSYRPNKDFITYEIRDENGEIEISDFSKEAYALLAESYRLFKGVVVGEVSYEPVLNRSSYEYMVSQGHLDED